MIRVTVELVPKGIGPPRLLGRATIANVGGTSTCGNYRVKLTDRAGRPWRSGTVIGFPRRRLLAWDLIRFALNTVLHDRG